MDDFNAQLTRNDFHLRKRLRKAANVPILKRKNIFPCKENGQRQASRESKNHTQFQTKVVM